MTDSFSKFHRIDMPTKTFLLGLALMCSGFVSASNDHNQSLVVKNINQVESLGQGRMTYWGFTLYDAKLYNSKEPKGGIALDIQYLRKFESKDLGVFQ